MRKINFRDVVFYALLLTLLLWVVTSLSSGGNATRLAYSEAKSLFYQQEVAAFNVDGDGVMTLLLHSEEGHDTTATCRLPSLELFWDDLGDVIDRQWQTGVITNYQISPPDQAPWWLNTALIAGGLALALVLWYVTMNRQAGLGGGGAGGGGAADRGAARFGRARTTRLEEGQKKVTFRDVAGADEEKEELQELVEFLKDPKRFTELGARIPKGVLLVGPPGTGKTLLAKAVAGEAGTQFLSISGSDFVELYVGVGASRVRDLFDQAKKESPAIIFIDEIDAVGRQRGAGLGGGHDEREQTLNQLLVEMDGFAANEGVVVLAATNRQDILDPALLRPGRFDRQVYVGRPDIKGREEILKIHARNKPLAEDVDLKVLARATSGFVGADLENLMNEAALLAARTGERFLTAHDLHEALLKVIAGPEKRSRVITEQTRKLTAYHEAGHAVVIHELSTADPVHQITIVPRGASGGMTISLPAEDQAYQSKAELKEQIARCLGGRAAEELVLGDISTGAGSDIQRASAIARNMIVRYGMSDRLGSVTFESEHDEVFIGRSMAQAKSYSEEVAAVIDQEVRALVDEAYRRCEEILTRCRAQLERTAQFLLEHETMTAEQFELVFTDPEALNA